MYPNPANNEITIITGADVFSTFTITNTLGQLMKTGNLWAGGSTKADISTLPAGIYYITLVGSNGNVGRTIAKW